VEEAVVEVTTVANVVCFAPVSGLDADPGGEEEEEEEPDRLAAVSELEGPNWAFMQSLPVHF